MNRYYSRQTSFAETQKHCIIRKVESGDFAYIESNKKNTRESII